MRDKYEGHTPAPWKVIPPTNKCRRWYVSRADASGDVPPNKFYVAILDEIGISGQDHADAHLIADAPMLAAENKRLQVDLEDSQRALSDLKVMTLEQIKIIERLRKLYEKAKTHPAGSWMSAALSDEDTFTSVECKRDFQAWFAWLEEVDAALKSTE